MYFKYDAKCGILHQWYMFLFPFVISLISLSTYFICLQTEIEYLDREPLFTDVWIYLFKGEKPFNEIYRNEFRFPMLWMFLQTTLSFMIGKYPFSELYDNHGAFALLKGRSRARWMISKLLWVLCTCILYYFVILITTLMFCIACHIPLRLTLSPSASPFYLCSIQEIDGIQLLGIMLLPFLTSVALSMLQTAVSLVSEAVVGFGVSLAICSISIFTEHALAFGNCSILMRNSIFGYSDIRTEHAIAILFSVIVISIVFCLLYFKNYDVLRNRRDS